MKLHDWINTRLTRRGRNAAAELARALNLSADKVSRMRKGERKPTALELPAIEAFFGESAPFRPPADDDPDRVRTIWIERNMLGEREAAQQKALHYLVYYTSKIANELERIASLLEDRQRPSDADAPPAGKPSRSRSKD